MSREEIARSFAEAMRWAIVELRPWTFGYGGQFHPTLHGLAVDEARLVWHSTLVLPTADAPLHESYAFAARVAEALYPGDRAMQGEFMYSVAMGDDDVALEAMEVATARAKAGAR